MASQREEAKRAITVRSGDDPELAGALLSAHNLQLEIQRENNRHLEDMRSKELGYLGRWIGGKDNAPFAVALGLLICGVLIAVCSLIAAAALPEQQEFWAKQAERGFGLAIASGAFIAGKGSSE